MSHCPSVIIFLFGTMTCRLLGSELVLSGTTSIPFTISQDCAATCVQYIVTLLTFSLTSKGSVTLKLESVCFYD